MSYKKLLFYQQATIIYDLTQIFCERYVSPRSRTYDQMVQASRSGKQNIAEAYLLKSLKGRLKLLGVSRGSLEELLEDYLDFIRQKNLSLWKKDSPKARRIRALTYKPYKTYRTYMPYMDSPEEEANLMICLLNQTNYLLDQQLRSLEKKFVEEGGYTENLFKKRLEHRKRKLDK